MVLTAAETAGQALSPPAKTFEETSFGQPARESAELSHILVVDDEVHITWMLEDGLADIPNCQVKTALSGDQALSLFEAQSFDLLVTDYKMPGMDGLALAEYVRKISPKTEIMMLTAFGSEALYHRAIKLGIKYVLNKPVALSEIRQVVKKLLGEGTAQ